MSQLIYLFELSAAVPFTVSLFQITVILLSAKLMVGQLTYVLDVENKVS